MYPRKIVLNSPKLKTLLQEKSELVELGRFKSEEIEVLEKVMFDTDEAIQALEKKVDISDLNTQAETITTRFNEVVKEMETLKQRIYDRMRDQVDPTLKAKYEEAKKAKEALEIERNKLALKIQQKADKIIPLTQKLMKFFIKDEYEDFDTIRIESGELVGTIFNHLDDFKKRHLSKTKK